MDLDQLPRGIAMQFDTGEIVYPTQGPPIQRPYSYDGSGLRTFGKTAEFLRDPRFQAAHQRGWQANPRRAGAIDDNRWIVHVALWAASHAARLEGDFVECGVNTGMMSLAICDWLDFNRLDKNFWLFDTYQGIPEHQMSPEERAGIGGWHNRHSYRECFDTVVESFAPWPRCLPVRGTVPESLARFPHGQRVAYLSIDMNIVAPEIAALRFFWDRLVPSAIVLLDDYGWETHLPQKRAFDAFAAAEGCAILTLPTGQGLMVR